MILTPIRCDICGELYYLEEETMFTLQIKGLSEWVKDEEITLDICFMCKEKILGSIDELQIKSMNKKVQKEKIKC